MRFPERNKTEVGVSSVVIMFVELGRLAESKFIFATSGKPNTLAEK